MNVIRLPVKESREMAPVTVKAVFTIFDPAIPESDLDREHDALRALAAITPPNAILREIAATSTPPADLPPDDDERPW